MYAAAGLNCRCDTSSPKHKGCSLEQSGSDERGVLAEQCWSGHSWTLQESWSTKSLSLRLNVVKVSTQLGAPKATIANYTAIRFKLTRTARDFLKAKVGMGLEVGDLRDLVEQQALKSKDAGCAALTCMDAMGLADPRGTAKPCAGCSRGGCTSAKCPVFWLRTRVDEVGLDEHSAKLLQALVTLKIMEKTWKARLHLCGCHLPKSKFYKSGESLSSLKPIDVDALPVAPAALCLFDYRGSAEKAAMTRTGGVRITNPSAFAGLVETQVRFEADMEKATVEDKHSQRVLDLEASLEESRGHNQTYQRGLSSLLQQFADQKEREQEQETTIKLLTAALASQRSDTTAWKGLAVDHSKAFQAVERRQTAVAMRGRFKRLKTRYIKICKEEEVPDDEAFTLKMIKRVCIESDNQEEWARVEASIGACNEGGSKKQKAKETRVAGNWFSSIEVTSERLNVVQNTITAYTSGIDGTGGRFLANMGSIRPRSSAEFLKKKAREQWREQRDTGIEDHIKYFKIAHEEGQQLSFFIWDDGT
jgi:hypothetical protein